MCMFVCVLACLLHFHIKKPHRKYSLETFFAKSPGGVHLILKQPKLNEGTRAHVASIIVTKVGSSVPGASWRAGSQPLLSTDNEAISSGRNLSPGLLRHLMDSRLLPADSPLHLCCVGSCITFLSEGWCRADRQVGTALPSSSPLHRSIHVFHSVCLLILSELFTLRFGSCHHDVTCSAKRTNWQRNCNHK